MLRYLQDSNSYTFGVYTSDRNDEVTLQDLYYKMKQKAEKKPANYAELYALLDVYAVYQTGGSLDPRSLMAGYTKFNNNFNTENWNSSIEAAVHQLAKNDGKLPMADATYDTQFYRLYYFIVKKNGISQIVVADSKIPLFIYKTKHICRGYIDETARKRHEQQLNSLINTMEHKLGNNSKTGNMFKLVGTKKPIEFSLYLSSEVPAQPSVIPGTSFIAMMGGFYNTDTGEVELSNYDSIMFLEDLAQLL